MNNRRVVEWRGILGTSIIALSAFVSCGDTRESAPKPPNDTPASPTPTSGASSASKSKPPPLKDSAAQRTTTSAPKTDKKSIDDALRTLVDAWENVRAISAILKTSAKRDIADRGESRGEGVYNFKVDSDGMRLRYFVKSAIEFWADRQRYTTMEMVEFATDGKTLEKITLQHEVRELKRTRFDPADILELGGRHVVDDIRKNYKINSVSSETRDGRDVAVFRCGVNGEDLDVTFAFDKQTGIRTEWIEKARNGEVTMSIELKNLNTSPKFDEADLSLTPFPYHTLVDETGPEKKVLPWEEVVKTLSPEELSRLMATVPENESASEEQQPSPEGPPEKK